MTLVNFRDTAAELNVQKPDVPQLFFKPTTSYVTEGNNIVVRGILYHANSPHFFALIEFL